MQKKNKRQWLLVLFGLPFAAVGLGILFLNIVPGVLEWRDTENWHPVDAQVASAELQVHRGDDSTTYSVTAQYRYRYQGVSYTGTRVGLDGTSDSRRGHHEAIVRRLLAARDSGQTVTAWVNPRQPDQAVLSREMSWFFFAIKLAFALAFALIGLGVMVWGYKGKSGQLDHPEAERKPWLGRQQWASDTILSGARSTQWLLWGAAVIWNLIAWPLLLLIPELLSDGEYLGLLMLLFPLAGLGLLYAAIKATRAWRRIGPSPLTLDPYPGAIGGHVGGRIRLSLPCDPALRYKVVLSCLYSYESGTGKNRSRRERVVWQQQGFATAVSAAGGTELRFRFAVPEGLPTSENPSRNYHLWKLQLSSDLGDIELDRSYEIPVFATGESSRFIEEDSLDHVHAQEHREALVESAMQIRQVAGGVELFHPALRSPGSKLTGIAISLVFAGIGFALGRHGEMMFLLVFGGLGVLGVLGCLYWLGNSLWVRIDSRGLETRRRLFGVPLGRRHYPRSELKGLQRHSSMQSSSGSSHQEYFSVRALTRDGQKVVVAKGIEGRATADEVKENLALLTGLSALD